VKAGGMRVSKKQENGPIEKNAKPPGREKTRYCTTGLVPPAPVKVQRKAVFYHNFFFPLMLQMSHKIHSAALQVAYQKPQPALEKFILPK
ncbi:DAL1A protein, partial [Nyctibius grandis]|nr:DAL1A protein [Nyctibius grandis]